MPGDGMALGDDMTIPAQRGGLGTESVGSALAGLRIHGRHIGVAPETRIRLRLAGFKLIVRIERAVIVRDMTAETELQRVRGPTATQQGLAGWCRLLVRPAILGNIVASEAAQPCPREREIGGNPPREYRTWLDINHMSLTSGPPPIMTRLAQLRHISAKTQCLSATGGGCVA